MMAAAFNRLKVYRAQSGLTQEEVAEQIGVTRQAVSKWEKGESMPDVESCIRLADLYGVCLDILLRNMNLEIQHPGQKLCGCAKVNDKGQVTIPRQVREAFGINPGDQVMILADTERGIALVPMCMDPMDSAED